uniref:Zinc finger CCCH domain-containing protein 45 n=2 Tax=Anthurium amnicola TaxID=1678845 RepID=A0A1D1ZE10_9ARAE
MEDAEGGLSFDFEGGLDVAAAGGPVHRSSADADLTAGDSTAPPGPAAAAAAAAGSLDAGPGPGGGPNLPGGRRSFRQTVCRHWLRGLCMKGEACGFLHQYDKDRMPVCRFFRLYGECREQDCPYKHTTEDIKECNMYKLGFCPNGPDCRYRHAKLPGPPPPVEEVFQKIQQMSSSYGHSNRFFHSRNVGYMQQAEKSQLSQVAGAVAKPPAIQESANLQPPQPQPQPQPQTQPQPQPQQVQQSQHQVSQNQLQNIQNGLPNQTVRTASPLPQGQSRYFIVKSCNRENLELSVQQGVWATQRSNEAKLNEAFDSSENVILIFSINRTRHFQGCAKMMSRIGGFVGGGNWKHAHGTAHYGRNFSMKWLKLGELSFYKTRHLRNPYNENLPVKISRDCQELEASIGEQLASLLYLEPDSELMAMLVAAESKREEEKAKGVNMDDSAENPDIVPFEDNEEEDDDSEEEEDALGQAVPGRGRGRGLMWPPHMPMVRGGRPMLGVRGFPPMMMGADGFGFGAVTPDGFAAPDLFGPRIFQPFAGPRFSGNFSGLAQPGAVFPGAGLGMMMGGGRAPFMGVMGMAGVGAARANRPMGMPPLIRPPLPPSTNPRVTKRDQRRSGSDQSDRYEVGSDQGNKGQETAGSDDQMRYQPGTKAQYDDSFGPRSSYRDDESESEDEAPRRSRHSEGKKKRRGSDGETVSDQWETPNE